MGDFFSDGLKVLTVRPRAGEREDLKTGRRKAQRFGKRVAAAYAVKSVYSVSEAGADTPPQ